VKTRKLHQVGTSLMVSIPAETVKRLDLSPGDEVEVEEVADTITIRRHAESRKELFERWTSLSSRPIGGAEVAEQIRRDRDEREGRW
jgi:AbrB family looped-hinge helix DNA binding protein